MTTTTYDEVSDIRISDRQRLLAVLASCFGWSLDLFDLFILLYVAPIVGKLFFPSDDPTLSLAAVYASFAVTLLMRPVGSAIFGSYADRYGRKNAMLIAVSGVGLGTAAFGLLPTLAQVGYLAPIGFIALRLVQGVFVGGVVASTHTVGTESAPKKWVGTVSGLVGGGGAGLGALLASLSFWLASTLFPGSALEVWGWRVMFFCGIISSVLGFVIFRYLEESPVWRQTKNLMTDVGGPSPLRRVTSPPLLATLLTNLLVTGGAGAAYYVSAGYLPAFLKIVNHVPNSSASMILIWSAFMAIVSGPMIGWISDQVGRRTTFLVVGLASMVLLPTIYLHMAASTDINTITVCSLAVSFLGNAFLGPIPIFLNERFPTAVRASGTGLSWNLGFAFGGMMPTFVTLGSGEADRIPACLAVFCFLASALFVLGALLAGETRGRNLAD